MAPDSAAPTVQHLTSSGDTALPNQAVGSEKDDGALSQAGRQVMAEHQTSQDGTEQIKLASEDAVPKPADASESDMETSVPTPSAGRETLQSELLYQLEIMKRQVERLERQARTSDGRDEGYPRSTNAPKRRYPVYQHELQRSNLNGFNIIPDKEPIPTEEQSALEVLLSDDAAPSAPPQTTEESATVYSACQSTAAEGCFFTTVLSDNGCWGSPQKLRIRSRQLLLHLRNISSHPMLIPMPVHGTRLGSGLVYNPLVFLRPFKFFIKHEIAIRESLALLESESPAETMKRLGSRFSNNDTTGHGSGDEGDKNDNEDALDQIDLLKDLKLLITFLNTHLKPTFELRNQIGLTTAVEIEFADLWHLFQRGQMVVAGAKPDYAHMVINFSDGRDSPENESLIDGFVVDCLSLGTDGSSYLPMVEKMSIQMYHGRKTITSLPVYPLRFHPDADGLRAKFHRQGTQFREVTSVPFCHKMAKGKTMGKPSYELNNQVIVDMALAIDAFPHWSPERVVSTDDLTRRDLQETLGRLREDDVYPPPRHWYGSDVVFKDLGIDRMDDQAFFRTKSRLMGRLKGEELIDDDIVLMQPYVHAFVLRTRQWVTVHVADLGEVKFQNKFEDLVLPKDHKFAVEALVKTHENGRGIRQQTAGEGQSLSFGSSSVGAALDLVKGKGSGLVILLHGPPGVGKTSTAECVADDTKRPLYPITCGDLGETAAEVEKSLQTCFQLAHKWGCVLLLDEADVFLATRTRTDLRHNAVTSVFLRSLEYYAGILFLTTNRVGAIDMAFKSRIQMSLFYSKLDKKVTMRLYEKFIERARAEQARKEDPTFEIKDKEILKFAKRHFNEIRDKDGEPWNGRQIRNAFQTAMALAEYKGQTDPSGPKPTLGKKEFKTVAEGFRKFDEYLVRTHGETESQTAKRSALRDGDEQQYWRKPRQGKSASRRSAVTPSSDSSSSDDDDDNSDSSVGSSSSEESEDENEKEKKKSKRKKKGGR